MSRTRLPARIERSGLHRYQVGEATPLHGDGVPHVGKHILQRRVAGRQHRLADAQERHQDIPETEPHAEFGIPDQVEFIDGAQQRGL